jgi:hypothetical protein
VNEADYISILSDSERLIWRDLFGEMPPGSGLDRHYARLQRDRDVRDVLEMRLELDGRAASVARKRQPHRHLKRGEAA